MQPSSVAADEEAPLVVDQRDMPYTLDSGVGERARIGLIVLATDQTIEHEFARILMGLDGVAVYHSRIENAATITPRTLAEMERGIAGAARLLIPDLSLDVVAYACTSASMVIGEQQVHARIREARPGVCCTTPMEAACAALAALGARRIAFIPPYMDEINRAMRRALMERGWDVPVMGSWNVSNDADVGRLSAGTLRCAVLSLGARDEVDAVFVACTNVRLAGEVAALEAELGKPVISSNLATAWHCLRFAGVDDAIPGFGELFQRGLA